MTLALFDLDNTLLQTDSDHAWGNFLVRHGLVEALEYQRMNDYFYAQYQAGTLDIHEYAQFSQKFLSETTAAKLDELHQQFMQETILPNISTAAYELVQQHRAQQHTLIIITATNRFITAPIARALGIEHLLAIEIKMNNGRYTRLIDGVPTFREGKVTRLQEWLAHHPTETLSGSYFYSDSYNDLPLLQQVDHPVVVDPDPELLAVAQQNNWSIISLRG